MLNPLDNSHLSGLIHLLHVRYYKKSFANFIYYVVGGEKSESMTNSTPTEGVNSIEYQIDCWNSTKLWEQMTEDHFWTAAPRTDVINKVILSNFCCEFS
jgi:hypothetical protein